MRIHTTNYHTRRTAPGRLLSGELDRRLVLIRSPSPALLTLLARVAPLAQSLLLSHATPAHTAAHSERWCVLHPSLSHSHNRLETHTLPRHPQGKDQKKTGKGTSTLCTLTMVRGG